MPGRSIILSIVAIGSLAVRSDVVLTGTVKDCDGTEEVRVEGVTVEGFDPRRNSQIVAALEVIDSATFDENDSAAMSRYGVKYSRLMNLLENSPALASATSDSDGALTLSLPPTDSVLIIGHADLEDVPYYWGHVTIAGRTSRKFVLDMSGGECKYSAREATQDAKYHLSINRVGGVRRVQQAAESG